MGREVWGKERGLEWPYPLQHHLADTAAAATAVWECHLASGTRRWIAAELGRDDAHAARFVALLAGLHDVGKAIPCFQDRFPKPGALEWLGHDVAAQLTLPTLLDAGRTSGVWTHSPVYRVGQLLGGHHGIFHQRQAGDVRRPVMREPALGGEAWHDERVEIVAAIRGMLGNPSLPEVLPVPVAATLTGMVIVADWLASDTKFVRHQQNHAPDDLSIRYAETVEVMRERVAESGLVAPAFAESVTTQQVWGFEPNPLQRSISEEFTPHLSETGLLIITAATGEGKTEAAFLGSHALGRATGRPGMFVGLPTMATANQMRTRVKEFIGQTTHDHTPVTLAHSMAPFQDEYRADEDVTDWLRAPNRTVLAGISVGTVDQALLAALAVRNNVLRLHGLTNKTLIVDEAHAYDPYMQALLAALVSWCGRLGIPVVLLSATLPHHLRQALVDAYLGGAGHDDQITMDLPYPGWIFVGRSGNVLRPSQKSLTSMAEYRRRRARVNRVGHARNEAARMERIRAYTDRLQDERGCVAVLCNTVASAQETFSSLRQTLPEEVSVFLLHSRFPQQQRAEITDTLIERFGKSGPRPDRSVVVATQVIEQSLDLDFDVLVSDLAPISLLIQRLGRCWRHNRAWRPEWCAEPTLVVLDPVDLEATPPTPPEWDSIYPPFELAATHRVLAERGPALNVPDDVDSLVQQVHAATTSGVPQQLRALWEQQYGEVRAHTQFANMASIEHAQKITDLSRLTDPDVSDLDASTRLGIDTARVIPQYTSADGSRWLDADHTKPWPAARPKEETVKTFIDSSITCPRHWAETEELAPDPKWEHSPMLRAAYVLPSPQCGRLTVNRDLGLVRDAKGRF